MELALDRQRALAIALTGPEALIDVNFRDVSLRDFDRLDEIVEAGRQATLVALPRLRTTFAAAPRASSRSTREFALNIDPVCRMVISPGRARATLERAGLTYYFCSANCRDSFERHAEHYLVDRPTRVSPRLCEEGDFSPGHWDSMIRGDRADLNLRSTRSERMRGEAEVGRGGLVGESAGPTCSHLETTRSECTIAPRQPDSQTAEAQSCRGAVSRVVAWSIIRLMA